MVKKMDEKKKKIMKLSKDEADNEIRIKMQKMIKEDDEEEDIILSDGSTIKIKRCEDK